MSASYYLDVDTNKDQEIMINLTSLDCIKSYTTNNIIGGRYLKNIPQ